jgi:hypothetical protein
MDYLSERYGLITDNDTETENGQLFLAEYQLLLDYKKGSEINKMSAFITMLEQLRNSYVEEGLYHRNPDLINRRIMSHDNLSGIMAWSKYNNTTHRFEIWDYLLKHLGTYDNSKGKSKQLSRFLPFNPSNFFIWGLCAESKIYLLFLPFFLINLILTCNKPPGNTSGKILAWVEMYSLRDHFIVKHIFKYYETKMRQQYGTDYIEALMKIYHGSNSKDFPINKILDK